MSTFDITRAWDGTRTVLDKTRSYHPTTPLTPEQQRAFIAKAKGQDKVIWTVVKAAGSITPRELQAKRPGMLLTSIRRSLNSLTNAGLLRKGEHVINSLGRPEYTWIA